MSHGFNVATALQTIHEHVHTVGLGVIPTQWMEGETSEFCKENEVFPPMLGMWFNMIAKHPYGDDFSCGDEVGLWSVKDRMTGNGWRRYVFYGSRSVMTEVEVGAGMRDVGFAFYDDAQTMLASLWCLNMMKEAGMFPFKPQVYLLNAGYGNERLLLSEAVCVSDSFLFVADHDGRAFGRLWCGYAVDVDMPGAGKVAVKRSVLREDSALKDFSAPLHIRMRRTADTTGSLPERVAEMIFTVPLSAVVWREEASLWVLL